jgi:NAD(P)-dependent dehydrogenase (short-subunit alcohol dehydrogenase family)
MSKPSASQDTIRPKTKPRVVLIVGAGGGIGGAVAERFAQGGYGVCLCRRSNRKALDQAVQRLQQQHGASAFGFLLDASKPNTIEELVEHIESTIGPIQVAVYNLGAQIGNRRLSETTWKQFELGWKLGTLGLFRLARSLLPRMVGGTLLVTSSTAAVRGDAGQHSHAAAMGGRRMLCQSLNAEFERIHVVHVVVDGPVDAPDTLGKMLGPKQFEELKSRRPLISPSAVAETYWHLAHQPSSTWTFELDLRSRVDVPWWNSSKL